MTWKIRDTCVEDATNNTRSNISLRIYEISELHCDASLSEYAGSVLTNFSQANTHSVSNVSLCFEHHVSSSLLLKNEFYRVPEDPGIETFFQVEEQTTVLERYCDECKKYMLVPIEIVKRCLVSNEVNEDDEKKLVLNLKSYGINTIEIYLICEALLGPPVARVTHLDLSNNTLDATGCIAISDLLQQSTVLSHLNLSGCELGPKGAEILAEGIEISQSIQEINLAKCRLWDLGGTHVLKAITINESCKKLDLSYNHLQGYSSIEVSNLLKQNNTLDSLNLRWNELYPEYQCSLLIFQGLRKNENLKELDLSWNGIDGSKTSQALFQAMKIHRFLRVLHLENNRFSENELKRIVGVIKKSTSLEELYLGGNVWSNSNVFDLVKAISGDVNLKLLHLGEYIWIPENAYLLAQQIMTHKPDVKIIFKGKILPNSPDPVDFRKLIVDRAKFLAMAPKKKKLKRDFGHLMINAMDDEKDFYRRESFENLIKKFKAKLDSDLINQLGNEFADNTKATRKGAAKRVAVKELAKFYLDRHPTERPPPPPPKKKRGKKRKKGKK